MGALKYIGNGFLPEVPARDLTAGEVKQYGGEEFLISTGLYQKPPTKQKASANKQLVPEYQNKKSEVNDGK